MNDGHAIGPAPAGGLLQVTAHRRGVEHLHAQRTGKRTTAFGQVETPQVGVHPGAPARERAVDVDDGPGLPGTACDHDHPDEDGAETSFPTPHARAHGTDHRIGTTTALREPGTRPSTGESTALAHESGLTAPVGGSPPSPAGGSPPSSERMSMRHPVSFAASRAF